MRSTRPSPSCAAFAEVKKLKDDAKDIDDAVLYAAPSPSST